MPQIPNHPLNSGIDAELAEFFGAIVEIFMKTVICKYRKIIMRGRNSFARMRDALEIEEGVTLGVIEMP